jgi:hypothetical protein
VRPSGTGVDNGAIQFDHVRVPRENLLNRFGDVAPDGSYSSPIGSSSKRFAVTMGALTGGRVGLSVGSVAVMQVGPAPSPRLSRLLLLLLLLLLLSPSAMPVFLSPNLRGRATDGPQLAVTIAVRYATMRRQFGPPPPTPKLSPAAAAPSTATGPGDGADDDDEGHGAAGVQPATTPTSPAEQLILDYPAHQRKLMPLLATCFAHQIAVRADAVPRPAPPRHRPAPAGA